jgi:hypothetical protein
MKTLAPPFSARLLGFFPTLFVAAVLAGCGGGGGGDNQAAASGTGVSVSPPVTGGGVAPLPTPTPTPAPTPVVANTVPVTVDNGPSGANAFNVPFVSVTICRPGTTVCQTIDHVMVDTGSYGLRLIKPVDPALGLSGVTAPSGEAAGECGQFVSGYTWGAIVQADVKLGSKVARAQSIQAVGQAPGGVGEPPAGCASLGSSIGTVAALGANGILGVGLFRHDCGSACASRPIDATYYACSAGTCTPTVMPLARQVANPVTGFGSDNNGVVLALPAVGAGGSSGLTGTLIFGIGTQANNMLENATVLTADGRGNFATVYKGQRMGASFIDSGSNGLFFNDTTIPACTLSKGFYCPPRPLALSATMQGTNGATLDVPFTIENVDALSGGKIAAWVGGPNETHHDKAVEGFDWGLPFFFGRKVYVGVEGSTTAPYWAF